MKPEEFFMLAETEAAKHGQALLALWCEAKGDWERAHALAQAAGDEGDAAMGRAGAWVHAYLHRVEGDEGNAGYWYARAGRRAATAGTSFSEERTAIAEVLLAGR